MDSCVKVQLSHNDISDVGLQPTVAKALGLKNSGNVVVTLVPRQSVSKEICIDEAGDPDVLLVSVVNRPLFALAPTRTATDVEIDLPISRFHLMTEPAY